MHRPPATLASAQIFRNGKVDAPSDYNGPREQAGIVSYLEKVSGPASAELKTAKEVRALEPCCLAVTALSASAAHRSGLARTPSHLYFLFAYKYGSACGLTFRPRTMRLL